MSPIVNAREDDRQHEIEVTRKQEELTTRAEMTTRGSPAATTTNTTNAGRRSAADEERTREEEDRASLTSSEVDGGAEEVFVLREEVGVDFVVAQKVGFGGELGEAAAGLLGVALVAVPADGAVEIVVAEETFAVLFGVVVQEDDGVFGGVAERFESARQMRAAVHQDNVEGELAGRVDGRDVVPVSVRNVFVRIVHPILLQPAETPQVQLRRNARDLAFPQLVFRRRSPPKFGGGGVEEAAGDRARAEAVAPGPVVLRRVGPFRQRREHFRRRAGAPLEVRFGAHHKFRDC
mmetsp:Transcript_7602/g.23483  ORF Transcript_7602/g.23483 Transcript_7602/m.23483 type:complete len:292 (+) Transcript_7602:71-946(+)